MTGTKTVKKSTTSDGLDGQFFDVDAFYRTYYACEPSKSRGEPYSGPHKKLHSTKAERIKRARS